MRTKPTKSPADHVVLVGTGEAAMAALWRLCAAGARIRWYADWPISARKPCSPTRSAAAASSCRSTIR